MARRLKAMGQRNYVNGFDVTLHHHTLELPLTWAKPQAVFVNSMSDLFHDKVPLEFIRQVFAVMAEAHWHRFQILTKRAERLASLAPLLNWPKNVWMGVTVENAECVGRIPGLQATPASVRFLSLEPLLGPISDLDLGGVHWVIVGGESGPGARPMEREWVIDIRDQCQRSGVPFFFKQWGGVRKKAAGRLLDGRAYDEVPNAIREEVAT